jgi:hypothetical protein
LLVQQGVTGGISSMFCSVQHAKCHHTTRGENFLVQHLKKSCAGKTEFIQAEGVQQNLEFSI